MRRASLMALALILATGLVNPTLMARPEQANGRLSPASLDLDTCGCPTTFEDPFCEARTHWSLDKTTESGPFTDPDQEPFTFTVTVTEGPTDQTMVATGTIRISNSGEQTPTLANVAVLLEDLTPGAGNAPGPSGSNWSVLAVTAENEHAACGNAAVTCDGYFPQSEGANLVLYNCDDMNDIIALSDGVEIPPAVDDDGDGKTGEDPSADITLTEGSSCWGILDNDGDGLIDEDPGFGIEVGIDNDGDGAIDEDPIDGIDNDLDGLLDEDDPDDDGDGLVNEDGPDDDRDGLIDEDDNCADVVEFCFVATFDISGMGIEGPGDGVVPSEDDLRIDLLVTFKGGGKRGGTCELDVDCDGYIDNGKFGRPDEGEGYVRTIQQRHEFDPPECTPICDFVQLADDGAYSLDPECAVVDATTTLDETIWATGVDGTVSEFEITGTVSCADCPNPIQTPDLAGLAETLDSGTVSVTYPVAGGPAYFPHADLDAGDFSGDYLAWCVDTDHTINQGTVYDVNLYSSYESIPAGLIEYPENLDLVNWILNQGYVGQPSPGCTGNYTYGDIQRSIWSLVEDNQSTSGLGAWSQCRVDEILAAAMANGVGFVPGCGETVGVIMAPVTGQQVLIAQVIMGEIPLACELECPPCATTITNMATLTCDADQSLVEGSPAYASFDVACGGGGGGGGGPFPGDFCSQTQGGWGTDTCSGNNTACLRNAYFDDLFPDGLVVGDPDGPDGDVSYAILLTSSEAVADYLPAGGTPAALTADQTDPETTSSGVFGGQLVAATLNVAFDAAGVGKCTLTGTCDFCCEPGTLGSLYYVCDVNENLLGLTVNEVIALANIAISGGGTPTDVTIGDLSDALALLNEEFVDCTTVVTGCLAFEADGNERQVQWGLDTRPIDEDAQPAEEQVRLDRARTQLLAARPNPATQKTQIAFELASGSPVDLTIFDASGRLVRRLVDEPMPAGLHSVTWDGRNEQGRRVASGAYFYRLAARDFEQTRSVMILR